MEKPNFSWKILFLFLFFILAERVEGFSLGISPAKLDLREQECAFIFNPNNFSVKYKIGVKGFEVDKKNGLIERKSQEKVCFKIKEEIKKLSEKEGKTVSEGVEFYFNQQNFFHPALRLRISYSPEEEKNGWKIPLPLILTGLGAVLVTVLAVSLKWLK